MFQPQKRESYQYKPKIFGLRHRTETIQLKMFRNQNISFFSRWTSFSKVSNAFWISTNIPVFICLSVPVKAKSINWARKKSIERFALKPDFFHIKVDFSLKVNWVFNYFWYQQQKWHRSVGFGISPCICLNIRFNLAMLHSSGKVDNLIVIFFNTSPPSLRNFAGIWSIPVALLVYLFNNFFRYIWQFIGYIAWGLGVVFFGCLANKLFGCFWQFFLEDSG